MVTRAIEKLKNVLKNKTSSRKNLIEYDDVMNQQRQVVYKRRKEACLNRQIFRVMKDSIDNIAYEIAENNSP